jgi:hypothetical protein
MCREAEVERETVFGKIACDDIGGGQIRAGDHRLRRKIKGLSMVFVQIARDELDGEDVVGEWNIQGSAEVVVAIELGEFKDLLQMVAGIVALLGKEFFQKQLVIGEGLAKAYAKPLDAGQDIGRRAIMGFFQHHRALFRWNDVHSDQGIGLRVDLQKISFGELHPDELAGEWPGNTVAAAPKREEAVGSHFTGLLLDANIPWRRQCREGLAILSDKFFRRCLDRGMDSRVDRVLKCFEFDDKIREIREGSTGNKVCFQIRKRLLDFAFAPRMPREGSRWFKAVVSTEVEIACVPLKVGTWCVHNKHFGIVGLHTPGNAARLDDAVLHRLEHGTLIVWKRDLKHTKTTEAIDIQIDTNLGELSTQKYRVRTPIELCLFTGLRLIRHEMTLTLDPDRREQVVDCGLAAGIALGTKFVEDPRCPEVLDVRHLKDDITERIEFWIGFVRPIIRRWFCAGKRGVDGVMADADEPANLPIGHLGVLGFEGSDGYPVFHCDHLSLPSGVPFGHIVNPRR